ncbi:MAG: large subunit ribosomal protein L28 [Polaribacter sp.]|jgi:large subunit ribosomal protein L28
MSKVCQLTGKRPMSGNNVSHSHRKTRRRFLPNLNTKRFFIPELEKWVTLKISAAALRSINKLGVWAYIQKMEKKGNLTGLNVNKLQKK